MYAMVRNGENVKFAMQGQEFDPPLLHQKNATLLKHLEPITNGVFFSRRRIDVAQGR